MSVGYSTRFCLPDSVYSVSGDNTEEPVFSEKFVDGMQVVFQSGIKNLQDVINEAYPASTIYSVLARCGVGDFSGLQNHGFYADISGMPRHIIDACVTVNQSKEFFQMLPDEVKSHFDSYLDFVQSAGTSKFFEAFKSLKKTRSSSAASENPVDKESEGD